MFFNFVSYFFITLTCLTAGGLIGLLTVNSLF